MKNSLRSLKTPHSRTVSCPVCHGPAQFSSQNRWRPFCSERCRLIDLGAWANNEYVLAGQSIDEKDSS
ncbi:MAG: DNA gyrase inhibitor YacG [Lautropia sp.]|nr:DNA gyrase inhibitor YacG [Lautropia sp.]